MDRRTALFLTMMLGGLVPKSLRAQGTTQRSSTKGRKNVALQPVKSRSATDDDLAADDVPASDDEVPPSLPAEPGQQWKSFDISRYTSLDHSQNSPQNAIVEWIFRRTGSAPWHGDKIAVLSASRTQIRAYHNATVLKQVGEYVERFTDAAHDFLSVRVRFVAAVDPRWRYPAYARLTQVGSGPQGQQIWTLKAEDAAFVLAQMQIYQGFKLITDKKVDMVNGQTLVIRTQEPRGYVGGLQRDSAAGLGYQPRTDQLEEGIVLRLSPLLNYDGDKVDAAIELTANSVKNFHRTKVIAPREVGLNELTLDVPEVAETRLSQTVAGWPVGQTLLISAGILPGILMSKNGLLNLRIPGTFPTSTELLVFIEAETTTRGSTRPSRDRE